MRTQFSTELEHPREQVAVAQERVNATERRALCEIDQERTLRQKGEQALADLRTELAAVQARAQDTAVAGAEEQARLQAERDTLSRQLAEAEQALGRGQAAQEGLWAELVAALRRAERAQAGVASENGKYCTLSCKKSKLPGLRTVLANQKSGIDWTTVQFVPPLSHVRPRRARRC
ncbi:hypothetical protein [Cupriavidus basilensis]|uniref:hypothetical protein n=1 Tax=Cupriavidus basilensis TaxID=68895 RepID=UPI0023E7D869|nr:hypothetical protein [Cupriavidus basilensis]MDF3881112.1 hypothetical protein [Cupriavidus basilensis]